MNRSSPRILLVAPSLRIMGGQAVMAAKLLKDLLSDGVSIEFQPINPGLPGVLRFAERIKYLRTLVVSVFYICSLLIRVPRFDVIHIFSASYLSFVISQAPAILISRMYGKSVVLNYRSGQCHDHLQRWRIIVYPLLRLVDRIVVQSRFLVEVFAEHGFEAIAIPNVVDVDRFRYRSRHSPEPRILVPRMLEPLYNVGCAIRAYEIVKKRYPSASLTILGKGSEEQRLRQLVQSQSLADVTFAGLVERSSIADIYDQHDVFVNSSSIDNMPVSILEAFAAGLPVVTTAAGGIPYIVADRETGHVVPVDDSQALASRVIEIMEDPETADLMTKAARSEVQKYRWEAVSEMWHDVYRQLAPAAVVSAASESRGE